MTAKKSKQTKPKAPAAKPEKEAVLDARGHQPGSRKAKVHALFDDQGADAASTLGLKLKLKEGTLRSWFMVWRRKTKAAKAPKPATKPADKVEATAAAVH